MIDLVFANKPFGLRYDASTQTWQIIFESNLDAYSAFNLGKQGDTTNKQQDSSWILLFTTDNEFYTVTSREQRYIFESNKQVKFYYDSATKIYDSRTNSLVTDTVTVLNINTAPDANIPFTKDLKWDIVGEYIGLDGYIDTKKIIVTFADSDNNGVVDNPQLFLDIVEPTVNPLTKYIVQEKYLISESQEDYRYVSNADNKVIITDTNISNLNQYTDGQYFYFTSTKVVKQLNLSKGTLIPTLDYKVFVGRDNIKFQYIHGADYESRIDPGVSNIIDIYILTKGYDTQFRQWIARSLVDKPLPPSSDELYNIVSPGLSAIKSISDEVVYHPVNYTILFGAEAPANLQATFKVTKTPGQVISDNDVKSRVITAINQFFALENWDFGDTFYFTELATYVMNEIAPNISNFVIVPKQSGFNFGSLFEIKSASDQLFINGATVDDIEIITGITSSNIKSVSGTATDNVTTISQQNITSSSYGATNG
jgi:hypothetical protein